MSGVTRREATRHNDTPGRFGDFGGRYVSELLVPALEELSEAYSELSADPDFQAELARDLACYVGRPSPLYFAERWSRELGGARIFFKREDLNHTGAHKINNTLGQALLARRMGKTRIIAETGAGQHGVATAAVAARMGIECVVYMGAEDMRRQALNRYRMELLGAEVRAVEAGSRTLKDAMNEAMRDWATRVNDTHYIIGSVAGPHPYPVMVRDFNAVVGREVRVQCLEQTGRLPDVLVACVGGGSNALGLFHDFLDEPGVELVGVEAAGAGLDTGRHSAPLNRGRPGVLHGSRTYLMQDDQGQVLATHSIAAGLDYPGVGPEHAHLKESGRATYTAVDDQAALAALRTVTRIEGILPALETAHALAQVAELAPTLRRDSILVCNISGRGDKDVASIQALEQGQTS